MSNEHSPCNRSKKTYEEDKNHYKVYYFQTYGRGEPIRQLLLLAGQEFEDHTISLEEWGSLKEEMPLGQVPVLEVNGKKLCQMCSILRFIAAQHDLGGADVFENARLDMIAEVLLEFYNTQGYGQWWQPLSGIVHVDKEMYFKEKVLPDVDKYAPIIEKFLLDNGNNGLFLGDKATWVDILATELFYRVIDFGEKDALEAYPNILSMIQRVHAIPAIKKRIATRSKQRA